MVASDGKELDFTVQEALWHFWFYIYIVLGKVFILPATRYSLS